ncbi:MAG TPA: sulfate ABC transporter permease subunit CysW [Fibrobacteria bacterium]|nr:sulfate ABC transporter permease subunit CysW [Fibrobacteria bacterium]
MSRGASADPVWLRRTLLTVGVGWIVLLVVAPILAVFGGALGRGGAAFLDAVFHPDTLSALKLTLLAALCAVPLNTVFGLSATWLLSRFQFRGRNLLGTLVDLPFSVSPVVAGLLLVLVWGQQGWWGPWLSRHGIHVVFAWPAVVLATVFVTFPLVVRELLPVLQEQGSSEEEAAILLGAGGWTMFLRVTLPNIKWALLYGVVLSATRAIGEFGAVSVVSGHVRGQTNTLPLHVEILYNEYRFQAAFAAATLLVMLSVVAVAVKGFLERRAHR